jgi:pSer/pThr/pTyr-binding forkhead associated (FHA) protein
VRRGRGFGPEFSFAEESFMAHIVLRKTEPDAPFEGRGADVVIDSFPFVVGRHPECSCRLADRTVSRYHCSFFVQGDQVWVQDMNSCNGTYVNGRLALLPHALHDGDSLRVAALMFRVSLSPESADEPGRLLHGGREAAAAR